MDNPDIQWIKKSGQDCLKFTFSGKFRDQDAVTVSGPLKMHEKGHVENASAGSSSTPGTWLGSGKLLHDQIFHAVAFAFDELMVGVVEEAVENG